MAKNNRGPKPEAGEADFPGFDVPRQNWFKMPNAWTNITAEVTSLAELKVVEYVLKHTWGYQEFGIMKKITTDEFMNGRKRKDGTRLDLGTGLSNRSVIDGLRRAVDHGFLVEEVDDRDKARIQKYYALRIRRQRAGDDSGVKNLHIGVNNLHSRGEVSSHRSEKETLERHLQKDTVNGKKNLIQALPDLDQPQAKTDYVAQVILDELGDAHSERFYKLVAAKVPEDVVRRALAEIKADGADHPAKVFTHRMKLWALEQVKKDLT